jgi:hypothetical protein
MIFHKTGSGLWLVFQTDLWLWGHFKPIACRLARSNVAKSKLCPRNTLAGGPENCMLRLLATK